MCLLVLRKGLGSPRLPASSPLGILVGGRSCEGRPLEASCAFQNLEALPSLRTHGGRSPRSSHVLGGGASGAGHHSAGDECLVAQSEAGLVSVGA